MTFCIGCANRRLYGTNTFDLYTSSLEPLPWIRDSPQQSTRKEAARMGTHHSWFWRHWAGNCTWRRWRHPRREQQLAGFWDLLCVVPWVPERWLQRTKVRLHAHISNVSGCRRIITYTWQQRSVFLDHIDLRNLQRSNWRHLSHHHWRRAPFGYDWTYVHSWREGLQLS